MRFSNQLQVLQRPKNLIDVKNKIADELNLDSGEWLLGQGTIYPDTITSGGTKNADKINLKAPVYLICKTGKRSAVAVDILQKKYPDAIVFHVEGGMDKMAELCH